MKARRVRRRSVTLQREAEIAKREARLATLLRRLDELLGEVFVKDRKVVLDRLTDARKSIDAAKFSLFSEGVDLMNARDAQRRP